MTEIAESEQLRKKKKRDEGLRISFVSHKTYHDSASTGQPTKKKKKNSKCALTYASAQSTQATRIRRRTLGSSKINKKNLLPQKKKNNKDNLYYHCEMKQNHDRIGHTKKKKNEQQRTENKGRQRKKKKLKNGEKRWFWESEWPKASFVVQAESL